LFLDKKIHYNYIDTIAYFKKKAEETGIAYQHLINLYLTDCAVHSKKVNIVWK